MPGDWSGKAEERLEQIHQRLTKASYGKNQYHQGFSYGIVQVEITDSEELENVLKQADEAMYRCKEKHKKERESSE